jgi:hypothetical protein
MASRIEWKEQRPTYVSRQYRVSDCHSAHLGDGRREGPGSWGRRRPKVREKWAAKEYMIWTNGGGSAPQRPKEQDVQQEFSARA